MQGSIGACNEAGEVEGPRSWRISVGVYCKGNRKPTDKIYILKRPFVLAAVWWMKCEAETNKNITEVLKARSDGGLDQPCGKDIKRSGRIWNVGDEITEFGD